MENKKIYKLTKEELSQIIKESINDFLTNNFINLKPPIFLKEDFRYIFHSPTYDNPLTIYMLQKQIEEGLMLTYPIDKTIEYIRQYFQLTPSQINKVKGDNGIEKIAVVFYNVYDNVKLMSKAMDLCGYYLGSPKEKNIKQNDWITLMYEPKIQQDNTIDIRNKENELVHITPLYNLKKIKSIGFSPKSKNDMFNYPDRVYFVKGSVGEEYIKGLAFNLFKLNKSKGNNGKYCLLTVDLNKIPKEVKFYYDPNYIYGVYTKDNISPSSIINIEEYDFGG